jgi:hypothetical protein
MKNVTVAYDILKKQKVSISTKVNWEEIDAKLRTLGAAIKTQLLSAFDPDVFIRYFNEFTQNKFEHKMVRIFPKENERRPSFAGFESEFFTSGRETVFNMQVSATLSSVSSEKVLGFGDLKYTLVIIAYGFQNNKKQKLSRSDWKWTNDHSFFRQPEKIFPKNKLTKIFSGSTSNRKFQKRDMELFLKTKLNATLTNEFAYIPLVGDYSLLIYRHVFMKISGWGTNGIYKKRMSRVSQAKYAIFPETEAAAKLLQDLQKSVSKVSPENEKVIIKVVNDFLEHYMKNREKIVDLYT